MNLNLIFRNIRDRRVSMLMMSSSLILYAFMIMAIYPVIAKNPAIEQMVKQYPKAIISLMAGSGSVNFLSPEGYLATELLSLWWPIIVGAYAMTLATAIVAKEISDGTMDVLLSQPVERWRLVSSRLLADITLIAVLDAVTMIGIWVFAKAYDVELSTTGIFATGVLGLCLFILIECFGLFFGMIMDRGKALITSITVFIGSHLLNGFSDLNETIGKFRWLSFFKYYKPAAALATGDIPWKDLAVLLGLAALFAIAAFVIFRRKDIPAT